MAKRMWMVCGSVILAALAACSDHPSTPTKPAVAAPAEAPKPTPVAATTGKTEATPQVAPPKTEPAKAAPPPAVAAAPAPASKPRMASDDPQYKDWFISLEKAKELLDKREYNKRQVIFIDARTYVEFTEGHIRGAMCYSTKYTQGPPQPKARNYLPGSAIVIYCHGDLCTDSIDVGKYFQSLHMDIGPVFIIKDGFPGWKQAYPTLIDKGPEVGFD